MAKYSHRLCSCGSGAFQYELLDGYGIFLTYACGACEKDKLSHYRSDIMSHYQCDEPPLEEMHMVDLACPHFGLGHGSPIYLTVDPAKHLVTRTIDPMGDATIEYPIIDIGWYQGKIASLAFGNGNKYQMAMTNDGDAVLDRLPDGIIEPILCERTHLP